MTALLATILVLVPQHVKVQSQPPLDRHPAIHAGPMLAYAEMTETAIWLQSEGGHKLQIRYWPVAQPTKAVLTGAIDTASRTDQIATFKLTNLKFGAAYRYSVLIDGKPWMPPQPFEFSTKPHWMWRTEPPEFAFAFGSCSYSNEPEFDRPGKPYGGDFGIFDKIAERKPRFMVWLGDNVYYREPDWLTESAMRRRWRRDRGLPIFQTLLRTTNHYAIYDDHDFGPNDSDRRFRLKDESLRVFADYFPQVRYGIPEAKGCFYRFEWGDAEFFMLDDRYYRSPDRSRGPGKTMLGDEQLKWLQESLVSSDATFKFICNGGQMINPMGLYESFKVFPDEQKQLMDFIAENKIGGVIFLTGDRHASELLKVRWPGAANDWYEFTSSPLTAGPAQDERERDNPSRVAGTWIPNKRSFGWVELSGKKGNRKVTLSAYDSQGNQIWRKQIKELELEPPGS